MLHPRRATRGQAPRPALIAAIAIPIVLVLIVILTRFVGGERPERVVQNYLDDLQKNQVSSAERWLSQSGGPESSSSTATGGRFVPHLEVSSLNPNEIPGSTFDVGQSTVNDSAATVPLTIKIGDQSFVVSFHLVKEDVGWRIDRAATNAEILKQEEGINTAASGGATGGEGGLPSGSGNAKGSGQ